MAVAPRGRICLEQQRRQPPAMALQPSTWNSGSSNSGSSGSRGSSSGSGGSRGSGSSSGNSGSSSSSTDSLRLLTSAIQCAPTWRALQALLHTSLHDMNAIHISALVSRLPKVAAPSRMAPPEHAQFDRFLGSVSQLVVRRLDSLDARGLANILWAVVKLGFTPSHDTLSRFLFEAYVRMHELRPQELANLGWALATMGCRHPAWLRRYVIHVHAALGGMRPQELANTAWALASLRCPVPEPLLRAMQRRAATAVADFKLKELMMMLTALSKMATAGGGGGPHGGLPPQLLAAALEALLQQQQGGSGGPAFEGLVRQQQLEQQGGWGSSAGRSGGAWSGPNFDPGLSVGLTGKLPWQELEQEKGGRGGVLGAGRGQASDGVQPGHGGVPRSALVGGVSAEAGLGGRHTLTLHDHANLLWLLAKVCAGCWGHLTPKSCGYLRSSPYAAGGGCLLQHQHYGVVVRTWRGDHHWQAKLYAAVCTLGNVELGC